MAIKKGHRPVQTNYSTYTGFRVDPTDIVEVTREKSLRGKYMEPTAHAKAHLGDWFLLVNGFRDKGRAIDAARKFEAGTVRRTPGPAEFIPGEDPLGDGTFAVFVRYIDVRRN